MTCEICGKKPAVVLFTQIVKNEKTMLHLCEECAKEQGLSVSVEAIAGSVKSLLAGALAAASSEEAGDETRGGCPACGLSYAEFKAKGRLGCPACYRAFAKPLERLLKNIHGSTSHTGKAPTTQREVAKRRQEVSAMRSALKQAIGREAFEEAARLRDRIAAMEHKKNRDQVQGTVVPEA